VVLVEEPPTAVTNIFSVPEPKILVTASGYFFHQYQMTEKKIDDPPNLKKIDVTQNLVE
jgi:hypothetical protein